jgi:membrane protein required for colicin V production
MHQAAAFFFTFVGALVCWVLLAKLVRMAIQATPLTVIDRLLGAGFGLLRGLLVLLVVATLVTFTPVVRSPSWTASQGAGLLGKLLQGLKPLLPVEVSRHMPS